MRTFQQLSDEHLFWDHLQNEKWSDAKEMIDSFYFGSTQNGFDDPKGIKKADLTTSNKETTEDFELPVNILSGRKKAIGILIFLGAFYALFGFIAFHYGTLTVFIIPGIFSFALPFALYDVFVRRTLIHISEEQITFAKSKKEPIQWNNILEIYFYHAGTGPIYFPGAQAMDYALIWKRDAVRPEWHNLNNLEINPTKAFNLIISAYRNATKSNNR